MISIEVIIIYILSGLGAGVLTGLLGLSAATIMVPILISFTSIGAFEAITYSLLTDVFASSTSAYNYYKNDNINLKDSIPLIIISSIFAVIGSEIAYNISNLHLAAISIIVVFVVGVNFIFKTGKPKKSHILLQKVINNHRKLFMLLFGIGIGFNCGLIGAGGGMTIFLILYYGLNYSTHKAIGTSVLIMLFTALSSGISHIRLIDELNLTVLVICSISAIFGSYLISFLINKVDEVLLDRIIGVILVVLAAFMAFNL